jgi:hypothetical protein
MDEIPMMETPPSSLSKFFSDLFYRFNHGDTPPSPVDYSNIHAIENPRLTGLDFDLHPGPIKDAIHDSKTLHRFLFVYIYENANPQSPAMDSLFRSPLIARVIHARYLFYAASVTTSDGYSIAIGSKFTELPLFLLLRPNGETVRDCRLFASHQGRIDEASIVAMLTAGGAQEQVQEEEGDGIRADQDRAFMEAEAEDVRREEQRVREIEEAEGERDRVEREFAELPELAATDPDVIVCKFKFGDGLEKVKVFQRTGPTAMLHVFVRRFRYPEEFVLRAGFPMREIPDGGDAIADLFHERSVVIYVAGV